MRTGLSVAVTVRLPALPPRTIVTSRPRANVSPMTVEPVLTASSQSWPSGSGPPPVCLIVATKS